MTTIRPAAPDFIDGESASMFAGRWRAWADDRVVFSRQTLARNAATKNGQGLMMDAAVLARDIEVARYWLLAETKGFRAAGQAAGRILANSSINGGVFALHATMEREATQEFLRIAREYLDPRDVLGVF